ncbi:MAG: hypothetical protein WAT41_14150 [Flavobacteriales bacterium]
MKAQITRALGSCLLVFAMGFTASAQYWESAGIPYNTSAPSVVYTDTVHDRLLVMAQFPTVIGSSSFFPLFCYDGQQWDTLGYFGNQVNCAVVFHDTLIVGGGFTFMKDSAIGMIACYADGAWHPYGDFIEEEWNTGTVQGLRVIDGVLYAVGIFETADGQYCNGLAKRVGGHWEPMPGWDQTGLTENTWVHDIIRYQGKLVVAGNFHNLDFSLSDMVHYDGNAWVPVCTYCFQGGAENPAVMATYQGDLYVGGGFYYATGNPGQGIMRWDGLDWYSLRPQGDGLQNINYSDQYSPDIFDLQVRDGLLYIGGAFLFVDHQPTPAGICAWDGSNFCLLEGEPFSTYFAPFDFYHDTLYGGTSQGVVDPNLRGAIRYLGELCSTDVGVAEIAVGGKPLHVSWGASGELSVLGLTDGPHQLRIYDARGRLVLDRQILSSASRSENVRVDGQDFAIYVVRVDNEHALRIVPLY